MKYVLMLVLLVSACGEVDTPSDGSACREMVDTFCRKAITCQIYEERHLEACKKIVYERVIGNEKPRDLACKGITIKIQKQSCESFIRDYVAREEESL